MLFCNKVCIACAFRGLVKLKKIGLATPQTPTHPQIYFLQLFWKHVQKKTPSPQKKKKSELGLHAPTHFRVFLGFLDFFNLDKIP